MQDEARCDVSRRTYVRRLHAHAAYIADILQSTHTAAHHCPPAVVLAEEGHIPAAGKSTWLEMQLRCLQRTWTPEEQQQCQQAALLKCKLPRYMTSEE
jgi:hypothetical protein